MSGTVERIWVTDEGSAPVAAVEEIRAVRGGLDGDRYQRGTGYYSGFDECEVTLIEAEAIERIREREGIDLTDGRHRRNVVTRGVDVHELLDTRFTVGEATFEGTRPRPPCAHVEQVAREEGVAKSLGNDRGGICARVIDGGEFVVGDEIEMGESVAPDPDGLADAIRDRLS
ncbi:MOSC domain-containing protein [Halorientalis pallida]|uniref:MOSC domain-containing protein n=1 Tax=Halorientalis pallida TaxID=2479928 RepID=A0A498KXJ5_9EURY|nr:MOSC domain-containing protein [Halorientalis pallida]RXK46731.1 MOSC domain-containing protein [Halorientalis pallida]